MGINPPLHPSQEGTSNSVILSKGPLLGEAVGWVT